MLLLHFYIYLKRYNLGHLLSILLVYFGAIENSPFYSSFQATRVLDIHSSLWGRAIFVFHLNCGLFAMAGL